MSKEACKRYRNRHKTFYYKRQVEQRNTLMGRIRDTHHNAKTRAAKKGLEFTISVDDIVNLYHNQNGRCAITGFSLDTKSGSRKKANPYRLSIDRVDSNGGYTIDNIVLVCWAVNQMKADRTYEEFMFWISAIHASLKD